jgi:hemerythrin-like domain-containing protein
MRGLRLATTFGTISMRDAIKMMKDRQRAMSSALLAVRTLARRTARSPARPDFAQMNVLVDYVERYPERTHQPNEERHLFKALLARDPGLARPVARAQRDHAASKGYLVRLRAALKDWENGTEGAAAHAAIVADDYVRFARRHARIEERDVLSVALKLLSESEWQDIERAFSAAFDPLAASRSRQECALALSRI